MMQGAEESCIEANNTNYEGSIVNKKNVQGLRYCEAGKEAICNV